MQLRNSAQRTAEVRRVEEADEDDQYQGSASGSVISDSASGSELSGFSQEEPMSPNTLARKSSLMSGPVDGEFSRLTSPHSVKSSDGMPLSDDLSTISEESPYAAVVDTHEGYRLGPSEVAALRFSWANFAPNPGALDAKGQLIFTTLLEAAPAMKEIFNTPLQVQAARFTAAIQRLLAVLDDEKRLKGVIESIGFSHLSYDVSVPRAMLFKDTVIDVMMLENGSKWTTDMQIEWGRLLEHVVETIFYCKRTYEKRVAMVLESWHRVRENTDKEALKQETILDVGDGSHHEDSKAGDSGDASKTETENQMTFMAQNVPTTYKGMFMFNAAVMGLGDRMWMMEVLDAFDDLVLNIGNPTRLYEESSMLAIRVGRASYGTSVLLAEYKSCMLASLRSLLPKDWSNDLETSWTWLWEHVKTQLEESDFFMRGNQFERSLGRLYDGLEDDVRYDLRAAIFAKFFQTVRSGEDHFRQSNSHLHMVADKVLALSLALFKNPVQVEDDLSGIGLRHVGYGIPNELFPPFVGAMLDVFVEFKFDGIAIEAFRHSMNLIASIMARTVNEGSTVVMKAINQNSGKMMKKALQAAPRGERSRWMLVVQVGTQSISPFEWSVKGGKLDASFVILQDLLTIRADRDRYYYAKDELFFRHPDVLHMLIAEAPGLLGVLLDGLVWRSTVNEDGHRRVNYYTKHLLVDAQGERTDTFKLIHDFQDPKLICHPALVNLINVVWSKACSSTFLASKLWLFLTLVIFICSQAIGFLRDYPALIFGCRLFVYLLSMTQLIYSHATQSIVAFQTGDVRKAVGLWFPGHLFDWREKASLALVTALILMFCLEPILQCWGYGEANDKPYTDVCPGSSNLLFPYSLVSMVAMILYFVLLLDLTVFSNKMSAYTLVVGQLVSELSLFLSLVCGMVVVSACSLSCLEQTNVQRFRDIPSGVLSTVELFLQVLDETEIYGFHEEPVILCACFLFVMITSIYLVNLLIAQMTCSYKAVLADMVGYARLGRVAIVNDTLPRLSRKRWARFVDGCDLDKKLDFADGDAGPGGGMQVFEPSNAHPTAVNRIRRYGGSTALTRPWPHEDDDDDLDRFARMEKMLHKASTQVTKALRNGHGSRHGGDSISSSKGSRTSTREYQNSANGVGSGLSGSFMSQLASSADGEEGDGSDAGSQLSQV
eukprot:TRINITY_DN111919_c0_g1_i1.p1 TRINITY_DN111919_c0_g1~~TRINITY_DN111919_c0_g1_i1.p1  ORF type:complete len:1169 (+),score=233.22 TRINITY_DN111919_c0_g1_i1:162-3668(+)